jgi:uncharacterized CHY-type Zn-finger protein
MPNQYKKCPISKRGGKICHKNIFCQHCKKELSETDIMRGICSSCNKLFTKPIFTSEFSTGQEPQVP